MQIQNSKYISGIPVDGRKGGKEGYYRIHFMFRDLAIHKNTIGSVQ